MRDGVCWTSKNHKVGEFIEKGYRTARRHTGAYITITQNIVDFDSDKASSAARAAWGNSSYKNYPQTECEGVRENTTSCIRTSSCHCSVT